MKIPKKWQQTQRIYLLLQTANAKNHKPLSPSTLKNLILSPQLRGSAKPRVLAALVITITARRYTSAKKSLARQVAIYPARGLHLVNARISFPIGASAHASFFCAAIVVVLSLLLLVSSVVFWLQVWAVEFSGVGWVTDESF